MKRLRRWMAFILCVLMIFPARGITVLAESSFPEAEHTEETLPSQLQPEDILPEVQEPEGSDEYVIYWNPGPVSADELILAATPSDATPSDAARGKDSADGLTPATPVRSLAKAVERAEVLSERNGLLSSDITIYAMNPMEIKDGELYILNGGNTRIASWPDRPYDSDVIFYINGGQLTLVNALVETGRSGITQTDPELIYVCGGALQIGQDVSIEGRIVMDYRSKAEETEWLSVATVSDAAESRNKTDVFHINDYVLAADGDTMELFEDYKAAGTWREAMIELIDGFNGSGYLLEVRDDGESEVRELVTMLYSDEVSAEEFIGCFILTESDDWELQVETIAAAQMRSMEVCGEIEDGILPARGEALTQKTLIASRMSADNNVETVYWNPGGSMKIENEFFPAGDDVLYDGTTPAAPVKTWKKASELAKNGIVICMRTLDLGASDAEEILTRLPGGEFYIASGEETLIASLGTWQKSAQPAIRVPKNQTLVIENLFLGGMYDDDGNQEVAQNILVNQGDLTINQNVRTEEGYIQINAFYGMADHPIRISSIDSAYDGELNVFFGDISNNIAYRYVDVAVPDGALAASIGNAADPESRADAIGQALLNRVKLHRANRSVPNGGLSVIDWSLRQDTKEDDGLADAQNIELYTMYYFEGIYIDGKKGNDQNYGASCDFPVKTWSRAVEIWQDEMQKSLDARKEAAEERGGLNEIEKKYPIPQTIYICDTITINRADEPEWYLPAKYDYATQKEIKVEIVSHIDHTGSSGTAGTAPMRHDVPLTLVRVTGEGVLDIRDLFIRNSVDDTDSVTVRAEAGGSLNLRGNTKLTGTRPASTNYTAKELTLGNHVTVADGGRFVMAADWTGSIENCEQGVVAVGSTAVVEMNNGVIQKNNSYRSELFQTGLTSHKEGGGMVLRDGATFTMNGGIITGNQTYLYGAGVYLDGAGTTFIMNKGKISNNRILTWRVSGSDSSRIRSRGSGIYAGTDTIVVIGNSSGSPEDRLICENYSYLAEGTGIYADGRLTIENASVSDNTAGGVSNYGVAVGYGTGIYIGGAGTLSMKNGLVEGNHGLTEHYTAIKGAGIYIASGTSSHTITGSIISRNQTGTGYMGESDYNSSHQGGGIFLDEGTTLALTKSTISGNRSGRGGGIYIYGSYSGNGLLTISDTVISGNKAQAYDDTITQGDGGGIYFSGHGNLKLEDGTRLIDNYASRNGGGLYFSGNSYAASHLYMIGTVPGAVEISGNTAKASCGGGIYHAGGTWHGENVLISDNSGSTGGGVYAGSSIAYAYVRNLTFTGNEASGGAGLAAGGGNYYMQDCVFTDNTASSHGGALYLNGSSSKLYLSESADGSFMIKDNHADYGGGIGVAYAGSLMIDITGPICNSADKQGSNFYLSGSGEIDIFGGAFKQPANGKQVKGVYNIYIDDTATGSYKKHFDMSKVTVGKKGGSDPDAVFLNTGNSYLTILAAPEDDSLHGAFPIDLNRDVFKSGSVVLKPAAETSRPMMHPNGSLTAAEADEGKTYTGLTDATVNMEYYSGGKMPRRNQLGGFTDAGDSSLINVIVVGQGVYLAGEDSGGSDGNGGTSPADAVATFGKAQAILRARIEQTAVDEADLPAGEKEGYAPFIYICGQVDVSGNEYWELNYEDALYTGTNQYYEIAERRNGDPAYEPQIRRFASFVRQPLIKVDSSGIPVTFTTGRLIIDGMADAVVLADQSSNSPVIESSKGTHVVLTGDSVIRNNYDCTLEIYGDLTLTGEAGEVNRQLYNNQSNDTVRLYESANMFMLKEAKIVTDHTVQAISGLDSNGIGVMGEDVSIYMSGNSAIVQEPGATLMTRNLIRSDQNGTFVEMKEKARLEIGKSANAAIYIKAGSSLVDMSGDAGIITLTGTYLADGIYAGTGTSVLMSERASIIHEGVRSSSSRGIYLDTDAAMTAYVRMEDEAAIGLADTASASANYTGIYCRNGSSSVIELQNNARITGHPDARTNTYGIYIAGGSSPAIMMNMEATGSADESAAITDMNYGIYLGPAKSSSVSMGKRALISGCDYGFQLTTGSSSASTVNLLMKDQSKICRGSAGINFYQLNKAAVNIRLQDNASIEQNTEGISEYIASSSTSYGAWRLNIEMYGNSRISGNSGSGIQLFDSRGNWSEIRGSGYQKISLYDDAIIGGTGYYDSTDAASGNQGSGISASSPVQITMNGSSQISGNGSADSGGSGSSSGIYLTRSNSASYYKAGTARVTLNDSASIRGNRGHGIYAVTVKNTETCINTVIIEVNGIQADGTMCTPSVKGNTNAIYLGTHTTLKVKGEALVQISDNPYSTKNYTARIIDNYGYLELDGRSRIEGLIYLNDSTRPITMTYAAGGNNPKYDLHLVEGFAGTVVVRPDHVNIMDLTGAASQLVYFNKVSADGIAAERGIVESAPNLILLGENHVYISGSGNDTNYGNTPSTAVRTFKRAKELLAGAGHYTAGANILVCNSSVAIVAGDDDWSFDAGGYITNTRSGETWQPVVTRSPDFGGVLLTLHDGNNTVDPGHAITVTFRDITIDGGSENGIILTSEANDQLMLVGRGRTAVLKDGAVFQNNRALSTACRNHSAVGIKIFGGTLELEGGIIRNMVRETSHGFNNYYYSSAILVQGSGPGFPAAFIMKSGQISDNQLIAPEAYGTNTRLGTIYAANTYSSIDIQGGIIENNRIITKESNPAAAGAIVNYNGMVNISGGVIRGNEGGYGSAVYHCSTTDSSRLVFSGGQFSQNITNAAEQQAGGAYSPIFIENYGFELKGGGADIRDSIYLNEVRGAIKVSDHIMEAGRSYRVYLNPGNGTGQFRKGSVIVEPDGNTVTSVSAYLPYFDVRLSPYVLDRGRTEERAGSVDGMTEKQCLILMKAVYLDSVDGSDTNTGLKPGQAVKTFSKAKSLGEMTEHGPTSHYVIYISGTAKNTVEESVWSLPESAYMSRYTGFAVYESDGSETAEAERAYYGCLIEPAYNLIFRDISVYGRRSNDSTANNGDSLVSVSSGITVTVEEGALFADNYNMGNYIAEDGLADNLSSKGGAFYVAQGGVLIVSGGQMRGNSATSGSAIYLQASEADRFSFGRLHLTGTPVIAGKVYLGGTSDVTAAYIQPDRNYAPASALQIAVENDYNGRPLIRYTDGLVPGEDQMEDYVFDDAIQALYDIVNNLSDASMLELNLRKVYYLDGQHGSDDQSRDGSTPGEAFRTLKRAFEAIGNHAGTNGVVIYIVDTIDVAAGNGDPSEIELMNIKIYNGDGTTHYEGYYKDPDNTVNIRGQVYLKRYSQPAGYDEADPLYEGYGKETLYDQLFHVSDGGTLILSGIYTDGHSVGSDSIDPTLSAPAVAARSPLITVEGSGTLKCYRADGVSGGVATTTILTNNYNINNKNGREYVIGQLNESDIMEGSSAGIELLDGATAILQYTELRNLRLGDNVISGGTDVYSNGYLHFSYYTNFGGTVFLEGLGTSNENQETSRYLVVDVYGTPVMHNFKIQMRDPYQGRDVVHYPEQISGTARDAGYYLLEERVKDFFYLSARSDHPYIFELQVPAAVYIDGTKGVDDQGDRAAGSTPASPVKTLKRAYELLTTRGGNTIYVVGTIQVSNEAQLTGMSYIGSDGTVNLGNTGKVKIIRYIQPDFAVTDPDAGETAEYNVDDFTGTLLNVSDGAALRLGSGVYLDGHSEPRTEKDLPAEAVVSRRSASKAPLIHVERGGALTLLGDVTLQHNNNTYDPDKDSNGQHGGGISNSGITTVDGTLFKNNRAGKGSVVYQDGIFKILGGPENMDGHINPFYLTTVNLGSSDSPVWGADHVIQTAVAMPEQLIFEIDMDHAVKGRDVVRFTANTAFNPDADAEHEHFRPGCTVSADLFLVESEYDPFVLELQNWEVLKVEVPADIYLVMYRQGTAGGTGKLAAVDGDSAAGGELFTAPEYTIINKGNHSAKVSITGFENNTIEAGITSDPDDLMKLTASASDATGASDLYLAVRGLDDPAGKNGFSLAETSLQPYAEDTVNAAPLVLGTLGVQGTGSFTFTGAAGSEFMKKYMDVSFPVQGAGGAAVQQYMDGTVENGNIGAGAKYLMKYRIEIDPARR